MAQPDALEKIVFDLRPIEAFTDGHRPGAVHFEGTDGPDGLAARQAELPVPARRRRLHAIVAADDEAVTAKAVALLVDAGFAAAVAVVHGPHGLETGIASGRLWSPAPLLMRALPMFGSPGTALDVGAGGGRDAAFLAGRGWSVTAVERSEGLIARGRLLAQRVYTDDASPRGNVVGVVRTLGQDRKSDANWLREHASQLVLVVRFLRRSVLDLLPDAVPPGGVIAYEHFLLGCEKFGSPRKPAQMLAPGELASIFSAKRGFEVVLDAEGTLDDGRPVNRFIAVRRRPAPE